MSVFANIFALFEAAISNGLKYPKIRLLAPSGKPVVISRNGQMSKNPGHLSVTNGGRYGTAENTYYGRVTPSGEFFANSWAQNRDSYDVRPLLQELAADPIGVATKYGKLTGHCMFCQKKLTDPQSTALGYGPVCAKHYGLEHSRSEMRASTKPSVESTYESLEQIRDVHAQDKTMVRYTGNDLTQIMEDNGHLLDERRNARIIDSGWQAYAREEGHYDNEND